MIGTSLRSRLLAAVAAATIAALALAAPASAAVLPGPPPVGGPTHPGAGVGADVRVAGGVCRTATTRLVDRPDSGNHGVWAVDTIVRTTTICETDLLRADANVVVPGVNVDARVQLLARYHATVHDEGTFTTVDGHSPNRSVALCRGCRGHLVGGFTADFTALASFKGYLGVYAGHTYRGIAPTSTGNWLAGLWGTSLDFGANGVGNLVGWSWTYWTCGDLPRVGTRAYLTALHTGHLWVDAWNDGDGTGVLAGDITGCTCPPPPCPCPTHAPSPSPSASVSVSPSPSDTTGGGTTNGGSSGGSGGSGGGTVVVPPANGGGGGGPVAVQPVANTGDTLPKTGSPVAYIAGGAAVLIGVGLGLFALSRRRRLHI